MVEISIIIIAFIIIYKSFLNKKKNIFYLKGGRKVYKIKNLNRGLIAIGGAGSGKTYTIIKPLLSYCISKKGCLIFDPKGDLTSIINELSLKHNKPILNFSLDKTLDKINPLNLCEDKSDIIEFSSYFLSGIIGIPKQDTAKYFFNASKSVLTGVIVFLKNKNADYCTIPHIVALFLTASSEELINLLSSDAEAMRSSMILRNVSKDPKLLGSIMSTFTAFFPALDTPTIFQSLITTDKLNIPNNPQNPSIINLTFNLQKRDIYTPIYSSIIGLIIKKMNTPNQYESAIIIDEFTVLKIPNFVNIPETARSNKIATCLAIQDISQLISSYGKEEASSIISNMGSQFLFRTTNPETLDHFERLVGTREVKNVTKTITDFTIKTSKNIGLKEKKILRKEEIINYRPGQVFGIISDGNKSLIESKLLNGNHYLKRNSKKKSTKLNENDLKKSSFIYNQVYKDIEALITPTVLKPEKFNIN